MSTEQTHRIALNGATMGTRYSCVFYAPQPDGHDDLGQQLLNCVTDVDLVMSNWKPESAISRLNAARPGDWVEVPKSLLDVLETAIRIEAESNGAFDIGVGDIVAAWGFGPNASTASPTSETDIPRAITRRTLELDRSRLRVRKHAPLALDLSGIAKGYGVDRLGATMDMAGISAWLVGIDGEMLGKGYKPDGSSWCVGHERPVQGRREFMGVIELTDLAVATSGTYRHFRQVNGQTVSHTINPAKDTPVDNVLKSVTVLAETCVEADAWATAILVDGHWPPRGFPTPHGIEPILTT